MAAIFTETAAFLPSALGGKSRKSELSRGLVGNRQLSSWKRTTSRVPQRTSGLVPLTTEARACCRAVTSSGARLQGLTFPTRNCQFRTEFTGTGLGHRSPVTFTGAPSGKKPRSPLCVVKQDSFSAPAGSPQDRGNSSKCQNIWLSDVVPKRQRPYFVNRKWTSKDVTYATYMSVMHALCLAAPFTFSWGALGAFAILYFVTGCLGITLSYHRNLSHKSFKLPKWLEYTFAYCGVLANQGDPIEWVSSHRYHHQFCDTDRDPHSPYEGFWHSHMGWLLDDQTTDARVGARANVADMEKDAFYKFIKKTYPVHALWLGVVLFALGGFPYVVWGMGVRLVWVYHITWAVNSACHVWGFKSWNTGDLSRNNWWVALLAFGEGWHNNHHAFEYSARHGLKWWQLDPTWYIVKALEAVGLATKVKLPSKEHKQRLAFASSGIA